MPRHLKNPFLVQIWDSGFSHGCFKQIILRPQDSLFCFFLFVFLRQGRKEDLTGCNIDETKREGGGVPKTNNR